MSAPTGTPSPAPTVAGVEPTVLDRVRRWRPSRRGLAVAGVLAVALLVLVVTARPRSADLDPDAVHPGGSRAVVSVLRDLGVSVSGVRRTTDAAAAAAGGTVLVVEPGLVGPAMLQQVLDARPARLVLLQGLPGDPAYDRFAAGVTPSDGTGEDPLEPRCVLRAAERAGSATLPGIRYDARAWSASGEACYDRPGAAAVVALPARDGRPEVVLLGSANPLTNAGLDEEGNAALALGLLGSHDRLVWWRPTLADPAMDAEPDVAVVDLVPTWVLPVVVQLLIASLLVAWWRGRRLGPLVAEPLPVVVRAGETTAGRARLLRAHRARGEAAEHLRSRAREQVRARLGLPIGSPPEQVVAAVAARTARPPGEVRDLLYGQDPVDDPGLVALVPTLGSLVREVGGA